MITVNNYTGAWQGALQPPARTPRVGAYVRVHDSPDARESDDFRAALKRDAKDLEWVRHMPRIKMDVYRIINSTAA
jgi:hypothetical protein